MFRSAYPCSLGLLLFLLFVTKAKAQQFIGLGNPVTSIQLLPYNPAYVNSAATGIEVNIISGSVLVGNNMYGASRGLLGKLAREEDVDAVEGVDYFKKNNKQIKRLWTNVDVVGPSVSFMVKKKYQVGVFTRFRTIVRAGGVTSSTFDTLVSVNLDGARHSLTYNNTGVAAHAFSEYGVSIGKKIKEEDHYQLYGGVSLKYLSGMMAIAVKTPTATYERQSDSIIYAKGTVNLFFTHDDPQAIASNLGAGSGWGIDIGARYVYYDKTEAELGWGEKRKYKWSVAASITDLGGITYRGADGSGSYNVNIQNKGASAFEFEESEQKVSFFLNDDSVRTVIAKEKDYDKALISLPTAFRLSGDYNVTDKFNVSFNSLINLTSNKSDLYRPAYVGYANITPRYDLSSWLRVGMPVTFTRLRSVDVGTVIYAGPLFVGSTTAITSGIINKSVSNVDAYAGLALKLYPRVREPKQAKSKTRYYRSSKGLFKRRGASDVACPPNSKW
ncbi:MAG: DUF5723 family protein [Flavipsychrobacter sp.]